MLKRLIPLLMVVGMIFLAAVACSGGTTPTATSQRTSPSPPPKAPIVTVGVTETPTVENNGGEPVKVDLLDLGGGSAKYEFTPADFTFSVGDKITFTLVSQAEFHTFTVDELEISVQIDGEATEKLTFTFEQAGTYELICIPHQFLGMVGTITVQ